MSGIARCFKNAAFPGCDSNRFRARAASLALLLLLAIAQAVAAAAQAAGSTDPIAPTLYDVKMYGVKGDGKVLDTAGINRAIDRAAKDGGGTVYFPAGTYLSGSIHMQSNINLHLAAGAKIVGSSQTMTVLDDNGTSQTIKPYDPSEPFEGTAYQDGGHTFFHNSLIWGENLKNVSITGPGMIDGGGLTSHDKQVGEGSIGMGDKAIALKLCTGVLLRDFTIFHGGHFAILVTGCDNMTIDNLTIDTNRDAMDIDCCRNTMVSNCRVNSPRDDGICPKSSYALGRKAITENLTITNCQVSGFAEGTLIDGTMQPNPEGNPTGRIKFGTEANGGFRNVTISNCTFRSCRGLALEEVDGGILENFTISNITMMDVASYPIYLRLGRRNRGPLETMTSGTLRNITISNVVATGVEKSSGIQIMGTPNMFIENVRLDNIRIQYQGEGTKEEAQREVPEGEQFYPEPARWGTMPSYGLFARHVRGLELSNIDFSFEKTDERPPIACIDVDGLRFDNVKAQMAEGVEAAILQGVKNMAVRDSPILENAKSK